MNAEYGTEPSGEDVPNLFRLIVLRDPFSELECAWKWTMPSSTGNGRRYPEGRISTKEWQIEYETNWRRRCW